MKLLWGSPLPPVRSGVSDYAVELLPELARRATVRLLTPPGWDSPPGWRLPDGVEMVPPGTPPDQDEVPVVHLGNNPYHEWLLPHLGSGRAVVVLHDAILHHLLVESTIARGAPEQYRELATAAHGARGAALARAREFGLAGRRDPFLFPARRAFLERAAAVVVHSWWARRQVAEDLPGTPVHRVGLAVADPGRVDRAAVRREIGVAEGTILLAHLGFLTPAKGLSHVLGALAAARACGVRAELLMVGEGSDNLDLAAIARGLGLEGAVRTTGWVEPETMRRLPAAADLGVVLRTPSAGETSAAAARFLACGTPVAVSGLRQFLEWPEPAAPRITPGGSAAAELARLLAAAGGPGWDGRRAAARAAYEAVHRPAEAAAEMVRVLAALQ